MKSSIFINKKENNVVLVQVCVSEKKKENAKRQSCGLGTRIRY